MSSKWIYLPRNSLNCISGYLLHLGNYISNNVTFYSLVVKVLLKFSIGKFVTIFELAIVVTLLLNSIICQMNKSISDIFQVEIFTTCSQITFTVPIPL